MNTINPLGGSIAMITGATSGIGQITAYHLAAMGAELFLVCRNPIKAERTKQAIIQRTGNHRITLLLGDLSIQSDIHNIADAFLLLNKPLNILVNNAGVFNFSRKLTVDGVEEMFAVNHLAPCLLTNLLLERIKSSAPARIVNIASGAHMLIKELNYEDLHFNEGFKALKVYSHSKLANTLFNHELAKRLEGSNVTANAVDPGEVSTGLGLQNGGVGKALHWVMKPFIQTPEKGARTPIYVCSSLEVEGVNGKYFRDCKEKKLKPWAKDNEAAKRLWDASLKMLNLVQ